MGKPPGSQNKKTLERLQAAAALEAQSSDNVDQRSPADLSLISNGRHTENEVANSALSDVSMMESMVLQPLSSTQHADPFPFTSDSLSLHRALQAQTSLDVMNLEDLTPSSLDCALDFAHEPLRPSDRSIPPANTPRTDSINFDITDFHLASPVANSSLRAHDLGLVSDTTNARQGAALPPERAPLCTCFDEHTRVLSHIHLVQRRHKVVPVDILLTHAARVSDAVEARLLCRECAEGGGGVDLQMLTLVLMTLQCVFRWAKGLVHAPDQACAEAPHIQVGRYDVSVAEARLLKDILVAKAHKRLHRTLIDVRSKIEIARAEAANESQQNAWGFEKGELRALETSIALLMQASETMGRRMKQQ